MDRLLAMRVFQRVSDEGGFAAAARAMDMSPPAVTRLVADLEESLGVRLMNRTTRRLALTQAGEAYLDRVREILKDIDEADAHASSHALELSGELRISSSSTLATHVLAPLLAGFRTLYPRVRVDVEVGIGGQAAIEDFDLTVFGAEAGFDADVIARTILETDEVLVASPGYLQRRGMPQHPHELANHELLADRRPGARTGALRVWPAGRTAEQVEVDTVPSLITGNSDTRLRAVLADAGITQFPLDLAAPYLTSGQLVRVMSPWVTGRLTMYAAMPSRRFVPERTRRFLDYLIDETRRQTALVLAACEACHAQVQVQAASVEDSATPSETDVAFANPQQVRAAAGARRPMASR